MFFDKSKDDISKSLGISPEREEELNDSMDGLLQGLPQPFNLADITEALAPELLTPEEGYYCCFVLCTAFGVAEVDEDFDGEAEESLTIHT